MVGWKAAVQLFLVRGLPGLLKQWRGAAHLLLEQTGHTLPGGLRPEALIHSLQVPGRTALIQLRSTG